MKNDFEILNLLVIFQTINCVLKLLIILNIPLYIQIFFLIFCSGSCVHY